MCFEVMVMPSVDDEHCCCCFVLFSPSLFRFSRVVAQLRLILATVPHVVVDEYESEIRARLEDMSQPAPNVWRDLVHEAACLLTPGIPKKLITDLHKLLRGFPDGLKASLIPTAFESKFGWSIRSRTRKKVGKFVVFPLPPPSFCSVCRVTRLVSCLVCE